MSESLIFAHFLFFGERCEWIAHKLKSNERQWAICSRRSDEMSDVSKSLILLTKNERMSESLIFMSESLIRSILDKKQAICLEIKWANSQPWVQCREPKTGQEKVQFYCKDDWLWPSCYYLSMPLLYTRVECFWKIKSYTSYVVPNCCRTPIPKFQVFMLPLSLVAGPSKIWTVTLKWAKKYFLFNIFKVLPETKYVL